MKKRLSFLIFTTVALVIPITTFFLVGCQSNVNMTEYEQFISDRTFSICGVGNEKWTRGTTWIVNKKDSLDHPYEYYIATNWHVKIGCDEAAASFFGYCDFNYLSSGLKNDYSEFASITQVGTDCVYTDYLNAIDLYLYDADFGNNPRSLYKTKLDHINQYYLDHQGHVNTFVKNYQRTNYYIGGYPVEERAKNASPAPAKWEFHNISYAYSANKGSTFSHNVDDAKTIWDVSPQYIFAATSEGWMDHGASGSMVINSNKEICGIYWGGFTDNSQKPIFYPCASIFNTTEKNFVESIM